MKKIGILLLLVSLGLLFVTACDTAAPEDIVQETSVEEPTADEAAIAEAPIEEPTLEPTSTVPPPATETAVPPTATTEPTATEEAEAAAEDETPPTPTVEPTLVPNSEVLESNCLSCHSNQQLLMDLAEAEGEPEESESSGVG
jgi:hypothetical protein